MSKFDDAEQLATLDAEFLSRLHDLVDEVYGERTAPYQDGLILETLIAGIAQHEAHMLLLAGGDTVEEGYKILGSSYEIANEWRQERHATMIRATFDASLIALQETAPQQVLDDRKRVKEEIEHQENLTNKVEPINTKTFAS